MTRILRVIASADPSGGGPIEGVVQFGDAWRRHGHVQDIVTLDPPDERHLPDYPDRIFRLGPPRGGGLLNRYRYAPAVVPWLRANAHNYDAVIVEGLWRYQTRAAATALIRGTVPYFVFTHGMLDPWFRRTYPVKHLVKQVSWLFAERALLAQATRVLFTTEEEQRLARDAFWPYRVRGTVVGYGTSDVTGDPVAQIAAFRDAVPALGARRFLLFLSRIHPKKGCDLLVGAFAALAARRPDLDLVIAGPDQVGLIAGLRAQAARLGIGDRVHFPGMLTGDAKFGAFRAADAFALTSHQENFGVVVAEALACGTPVLISDKVNIWREIEADGAGLVAPDTQAGSTGLLARFAALDPAQIDRMRANARTCFVARFEVESAARTLMALIQANAEPARNSLAGTPCPDACPPDRK